MRKTSVLLLRCCLAASFFLLVGNANAFTCRTSDGGIIPPGGSNTPVDVRVRIGPQLSYGKNEIVNVSQVTCKNDVASWWDYLKTDAPALTMNTGIFGAIGSGMTINGADYNSPVSSNISVLNLTGLQTSSVAIRVFIVLNRFLRQISRSIKVTSSVKSTFVRRTTNQAVHNAALIAGG